ncbi:ATP-dependent RNA helicase DDX54-like [Mya arenaria]|uniref:ATP-dependent RNA helicase DDX54-like n=1 Tax=Mya arenaria TaxID=6604 RepID=UPI0022E023BC|nr:ATP-dependent RNA helicase DDX54-like [Mya arenaria]
MAKTKGNVLNKKKKTQLRGKFGKKPQKESILNKKEPKLSGKFSKDKSQQSKNAKNTKKDAGKTKFKRNYKKKDVEGSDSSDFEEVEERSLVESKTKEIEMDSGSSSEEEEGEVRSLVQQQNRKKKKSGGFQAMGLSHNVFKGVHRKGYKIPTPIQRKAIPVIMEGRDVVAMARTGSGKTAAFLIPMFERLQTHSGQAGARALIMSPTRELALQTLKFAKELGKYTGLRAAVVLGGDRMEEQFSALHSNPDIIIATPGRFMHVAVEMDLKLKSVQYAVFDEADRLFEMGFQEHLNEVLNRLPESRQTLLFSATLPKLLVEFAKAGLHDPSLIRLDVETKLSDQLKLSFLQCRLDDKVAVLLYLLKHVISRGEQTVVFAATKHHVEYLNMILEKASISCTYIYSSLDPTARKISIAKFQHRKVLVMVVTDLAARGIDIPLLDNVINFHFPAKPKLFVHRVGRVARAGRKGVAYSLISPDEISHVYDLHVFLGRPLNFVPIGKQAEDDDGLYGRVPQSVVDDSAESLRSMHEDSYDIKAMVKVVENAYGHYLRSRPAPAPESVKRVKESEKLGQQIGVHPMFGIEENSLEAERLKLLDALKSYRGNTTIFEVNSTAKNTSFEVMKKKRDFHGRVVENRQREVNVNQSAVQTVDRVTSGSSQQAEESDLREAFSVVIGGKKSKNGQSEDKLKKGGNQSVRDEEHYVSYRPADYQTEQGLRLGSGFDREAASALLDMAGDDNAVIKKSQNTVKWDRKRKKFVRENSNDPRKKKIRTESGALIPASYKSHAYKEWVGHNRLDTTVERNTDDGGGTSQRNHGNVKRGLTVLGGGDPRRRHRKGAEGEVPGKVRGKFKRKSELKRPEQIVKSRKQKMKKEAFQKQRQNKHSSNRSKPRRT